MGLAMKHVCRAVAATIVAFATVRVGAEQLPPSAPRPMLSARSVPVRLAPPRRDVLGMIQGNALDSANRQLANVPVRLRDARFGRIVDTQMTDHVALFAFKGLDPGTYIVELMAPDETVLAASQLLSVNAGEAVSAVVKLPFHAPPFAGLLGNTASSAAAITSQAAASALMTVTTAGAPTCAEQ
jgi:hypothetical protein